MLEDLTDAKVEALGGDDALDTIGQIVLQAAHLARDTALTESHRRELADKLVSDVKNHRELNEDAKQFVLKCVEPAIGQLLPETVFIA